MVYSNFILAFPQCSCGIAWIACVCSVSAAKSEVIWQVRSSLQAETLHSDLGVAWYRHMFVYVRVRCFRGHSGATSMAKRVRVVEASVVTEGVQQEKLLGESSAPMKTARGRTLKSHKEVLFGFVLLFFVRWLLKSSATSILRFPLAVSMQKSYDKFCSQWSDFKSILVVKRKDENGWTDSFRRWMFSLPKLQESQKARA